MTQTCRNIIDRTRNPKSFQTDSVESARNYCRTTSKDFWGIFAFSEEGQEPTEFWKDGRKYSTAYKAHSRR